MENFSQDLRYALRQLWAARGLTALAVLTLALGIGSNTALFTVVESVLLRPLPYAHADRLASIGPRQDTPSFSSTSWLNYRDIRDQSQTFEAVAAFIPDLSVLENKQASKTVVAVRVTPNLFSVLGVQPLLGRVFTPAEGQTGGAQAALLSEGLWRQDFHADPAVVGRTVKIGGIPRTVVGVMPAALRFPEQDGSAMASGLWLPLQPTALALNLRSWDFIQIVGELRTGVTIAQAQSELDAIAGRIRRSDPDESRLKLQATAYQDLLTGSVRPAFYALLGAVALVLLIACANVANLLIARSLGRKQEFAVRVALGAGRSRLLRQSLTEGALLSILGCIGGFLLAALALTLVHKMPDEAIPRSYSIGMHWTVLLALAAIATLTTVLSSLLPALLAARTDPQAVLQAAGRGLGARSGGSGLTRWLVIGEVALSSLLLIGTGLLFHTLWNLEHAPLGFDATRVTTFTAMPPNSAGFSSMAVSTDTAHPPTSLAESVYTPVLARMRAEPGVQSAALITETPFSGANVHTGFDILNQPRNTWGHNAQITAVSADYARSMGIAILRGRMVGDGDTANAPYVIAINQTLAKKYFPNKDPLGQQLDLGGKDTGMLKPYTVVGVLADQVENRVGGSVDPLILVPYGQVPTTSLFYQGLLSTAVSFVVKTGGDVPVAPEMRDAFHGVAPGFALDEFQTMQKLVDTSIFSERLSLYLTAAFAGLAILMVVAGLYGVLAQLVGYRRHEIGVRMALGATRESMARLILKQGSVLIGTGLALGLALSLLLGQSVKSFLYHVAPADAWTYLGVILLSLLVGLLASLLPAYRAASIEPMEALREQ